MYSSSLADILSNLNNELPDDLLFEIGDGATGGNAGGGGPNAGGPNAGNAPQNAANGPNAPNVQQPNGPAGIRGPNPGMNGAMMPVHSSVGGMAVSGTGPIQAGPGGPVGMRPQGQNMNLVNALTGGPGQGPKMNQVRVSYWSTFFRGFYLIGVYFAEK